MTSATQGLVHFRDLYQWIFLNFVYALSIIVFPNDCMSKKRTFRSKVIRLLDTQRKTTFGMEQADYNIH